MPLINDKPDYDQSSFFTIQHTDENPVNQNIVLIRLRYAKFL